MSREVPFEPEARCDNCGTYGAYDFMGDYLCAECAAEAEDKSAVPESSP